MYICVPHVCGACPWRSEEGMGFPGTRVTDGCGCWELNSDVLQKQQTFFSTEPPLQCPAIPFRLYVNRYFKMETLILCVYGHVFPCVGRPAISLLCCPSDAVLLIVWGRISCWPRVHHAGMAGEGAPGNCLCLYTMLVLQNVPLCLVFTHGFRRSKSGPHACMAKHFTNWTLSPDHNNRVSGYLRLAITGLPPHVGKPCSLWHSWFLCYGTQDLLSLQLLLAASST